LIRIVITLNVNHTVDAEPVEEGAQGAEEGGEMRSRPHFDVDIVKGTQTLTFSCSYAVEDGEQQAEGGQEDYSKEIHTEPLTAQSYPYPLWIVDSLIPPSPSKDMLD